MLQRFLIVVALLITPGLSRADLMVSGTLTEETSVFNPGIPGITLNKSLAIISKAIPRGTFNHDFSTLGETPWSVTWQAPAGQRIEVAVPADWLSPTPLFLTFRGGGHSVSAGDFVDSSPGVSFAGFAGASIGPTGSMHLTGPGAADTDASFGGSITIPLTPGSVFSFESATVSTTVPTSYGGLISVLAGCGYRVRSWLAVA